MPEYVTLNAGSNGDKIAADEVTIANELVKAQRVKLIHGGDGVFDGDVARANPLPVQVINTSRSEVRIYGVGLAVTATDTLLSLTKQVGTAAASAAATSIAITNGKRLKITHLSFASRGHATTTLQATTFNLRVNTAGAVAVGSPLILSARSATPLVAGAWDRYVVDLGADGIEIPGNASGTQATIGVSAISAFAANAPTIDVTILGYEY